MPATDTELAIAAAEAAAAVVLAKYGHDLHRIEKSGTDFATETDVEAEQAIMTVLGAARPDDERLGEELGRVGTGANGRRWLVDPLCGTLNYAAQTPLVCVNVALAVGGTTVAAASADPFTAEVFWTDGNRACLRRNQSDEPLVPSAHSRLVDVNLDPPFPNAPRFTATRLLGSTAFASTFRPRVISTTLALAWVAAGRRAAYVTDGDLRGSVHFSAGIALCESAGCVVTDLRGHPVHSGSGGLIAAADEQTHRALRAIVDEQGPVWGDAASQPAG